ncbi:hypothetical protein DL769_006167 [Monosporascus sp. CRB-8-3]|nr:hypothetical protein DL769_006167 [Monosporascus sp. CRB-8-3]
MRMSVALLRDVEAEIKAKEKAETPTVKTKEQTEKEDAIRAKHGTTNKDGRIKTLPFISVWRRKFRPLPEAKAVDLFAEVVGDAFILLVAASIILYESHRQSQKPDSNAEQIKELSQRFDELEKRERDLEEAEKQYHSRVLTLEQALRDFKDPKTKQPLLPPAPTPSTPVSA